MKFDPKAMLVWGIVGAVATYDQQRTNLMGGVSNPYLYGPMVYGLLFGGISGMIGAGIGEWLLQTQISLVK